MRHFSKRIVSHLICLVLLQFIFFLFHSQLFAAGENNTPPVNSNIASQQSANAEKIMAGLSDEQVRAMLIDELSKEAPLKDSFMEKKMIGPAGLFNMLLGQLSNEHDESLAQVKELMAGIPKALPDLSRVFVQLCPYGTSKGAMLNILWVALFIGIGAMSELFFRKTFINKLFVAINDTETEQMSNLDKLVASFTRILPDILGIVIFFCTSYLFFVLFIRTDSPYVQLFFFASLIAFSVIRSISIISKIIFSPTILSFRIIPLECQIAWKSHQLLVWTSGYIVIALMFAVIARKLGAEIVTARVMQLFMASFLLVVTGFAAIFYRLRIQKYILETGLSEHPKLGWGRKQFAAIWHILALTYLTILWLLLIDNLADTTARNSGAFILSFFVVPIWMMADRIVLWIIKYAMNVLKLHNDNHKDLAQPTEEELLERQKGLELYLKVKGLARICVVGALFVWLASLWNIKIPFFSQLAGIMLDGLIIMTLALLLWQAISSWIEKKIQESLPEEEDENEDDEWGGAASRGRAYTLLPMIRKFIGTILVVMVTMTILSSMGVDIGPLLAGAGVIGLAIGFGAQKLVADMFSGFFYLLDDAFRVGEYLTAGSVSGTVESITLRNVMLRHHRGMLQIVPHSELGAITNYMRGGIIVKFNLDFPYDAQIDKIRKIIKKVGQKMLENEDYGKDFIRPVKSQGVREITNSVMTIRVKFTAQPGTHFVIRREAYRLITEALNNQNIYYAHRKVIVDLPDAENSDLKNEEKLKQLSHAAGAAAQKIIEEGETGAEQNKNKPDNGMMG